MRDRDRRTQPVDLKRACRGARGVHAQQKRLPESVGEQSRVRHLAGVLSSAVARIAEIGVVLDLRERRRVSAIDVESAVDGVQRSVRRAKRQNTARRGRRQLEIQDRSRAYDLPAKHDRERRRGWRRHGRRRRREKIAVDVDDDIRRLIDEYANRAVRSGRHYGCVRHDVALCVVERRDHWHRRSCRPDR